MRATVIAGKARTSRNWVTKLIHTKTGMRIRVMPGARMLMMVTRKLKPASIDDTPRICSPSIQKSMVWRGENCAGVGWGERRVGEVGLAEPSAVRGEAEEPAGVEEQGSGQEDPV